ncbi:MAG: sulfatase [Candidatus Eisenbacteria bacterium]
MRTCVRLTLLLCVCLALSCGQTSERKLNLLIIAVDTLRPDHLGCYGYERNTSPNIDGLAAGGVLFESAVSQSPWTLPSFATTLTSLYPTQHGAGFIEPGVGSYGRRMRTVFPPLAMVLLKHGYATGAIINAPALAVEFGVDRGFEFYDTTPRWVARIADGTTADALKWLDENKDVPFFAFVHYFDPHLDYEPPAPYDTLFDPGYRGRIGKIFDRETYESLKVGLSREGDPAADADWNHVRALYDGEIAFTDVAVGDLLKGIEERGLKDNTLIVLLGDHGEEFFEHRGFEHGHTLFDELIKVPLIFSLPGVVPENTKVGEQVRLLDVMPTILDILGITATTHLEGVSLEPLITGRGEAEPSKVGLLPPKFAYSESMLYGAEKKSLTAYPWKLIYNTVTGEEMLLNLAADPGEHHDVLAGEIDTRKLMENVLFGTLFTISESWFVEISGGGESHTFDFSVKAQQKPFVGSIQMAKILDLDGNPVDSERAKLKKVSSYALKIEGLELKGTVRLAFKANPKRASLTFDCRIDGEPATGMTFTGPTLSPASEMPFTEKPTKQAVPPGPPQSKPQAPYILIWRSGDDLQPDTPVKLSEDTKQRLRALGYIQ